MSRILITGMTSPQTSRALNKKSLSFSGVIEKVLADDGNIVSMCEPDITWTRENLDIYDAVIVGLAPITSISANHCYGALSVIDLMYDSGKLVLLVDAPNPAQISTSLRAVTSNPSNLAKSFYYNRRGYQLMTEQKTFDRVFGVISRLIDGHSDWPTTIYPSLPWKSNTSVVDELPYMAGVSLVDVNLDAYLLQPQNPLVRDKRNVWAADSVTSTWMKKVVGTLNSPVELMKQHKGVDDKRVEEVLMSSLGSLITPHRGGTWWSYRYIQSLNQLTPVATNWQESMNIGDSWNVLAASIEHMLQAERDDLAVNQYKEYLSSIPNKKQALEDLYDALSISKKNRKVQA